MYGIFLKDPTTKRNGTRKRPASPPNRPRQQRRRRSLSSSHRKIQFPQSQGGATTRTGTPYKRQMKAVEEEFGVDEEGYITDPSLSPSDFQLLPLILRRRAAPGPVLLFRHPVPATCIFT